MPHFTPEVSLFPTLPLSISELPQDVSSIIKEEIIIQPPDTQVITTSPNDGSIIANDDINFITSSDIFNTFTSSETTSLINFKNPGKKEDSIAKTESTSTSLSNAAANLQPTSSLQPNSNTTPQATLSMGMMTIPGTELLGVDCNGLEEAGVQMGIKVRGLDLMRYGRIDNGLYICTECERSQLNKTFKTSYSFQRHAYLYHEGSPKRFPCPVCHKEFSRPDKRKSHLKEKHGLLHNEPIEQILDFAATI